MNKKRVLVAMSGGVDSSVAALLLCRQAVSYTQLDVYKRQEHGGDKLVSLKEVSEAESVSKKYLAQIVPNLVSCLL